MSDILKTEEVMALLENKTFLQAVGPAVGERMGQFHTLLQHATVEQQPEILAPLLRLLEQVHEPQPAPPPAPEDVNDATPVTLAEAEALITAGGGHYYGPESILQMGFTTQRIDVPDLPSRPQIERHAAQGSDLRMMVNYKDSDALTPNILLPLSRRNPNLVRIQTILSATQYAAILNHGTPENAWVFTKNLHKSTLFRSQQEITFPVMLEGIYQYLSDFLYRSSGLPTKIFQHWQAVLSFLQGLHSSLSPQYEQLDDLLRLGFPQMFLPNLAEAIFFAIQSEAMGHGCSRMATSCNIPNPTGARMITVLPSTNAVAMNISTSNPFDNNFWPYDSFLMVDRSLR